MEFTFEGLDMTAVNEVIKKIDFETFLKGVFYIGNEMEQIHSELSNIRNVLISIDKSVFKE